MRRRSSQMWKWTALAGAGSLLLAAVSFGQAPSPAKPEVPDSGETIFSSETRLVPLNVSVTDKAGHLVTNLPQSAFTVLENGVPQEIRLFRREDVPVSLGLIIDNSGSMRDKRQSVESAALTLVRESNKMDESFVVNFNDEAYLDAPTDGAGFTSDIKVLEQGLTKIDARGGTAMRNALRMSIDHMKGKAKRDKKVLLVVTDGNDNASEFPLPALVQLAQQNDVLIYAIGLLSEEEKKQARQARRALDLLVESTGGQAFYPKDVTEVEKIAREVAHDLRNQYTIAYTPANQSLDGSFRTIRVQVKTPGNLVARTRQGYYAIQKGGSAPPKKPF